MISALLIQTKQKLATMAIDGDSGYEESAKRVKYDRQLRLWDDHGQSALESAHVCLINANATGTEILKSLVLPGIGAFTILDGAKVTGEDAGNNFFIYKDSIGKSRAKVTTENLMELNPDVRGDYVEESVVYILQAEPNFFKRFTVVIATAIEEHALLMLAEKLWNLKIPLVLCRAYGMIGYLRLQYPDRTIIETRPENEFHDLRLDKPFPTLKMYIDSVDLDSLNDQEHAHIPYVIILSKYLEEWRKKNKDLPKLSKEKNLFKANIMKGMRKKDEEENFLEACRAVNTAVTKTTISGEIRDILSNPSCDNLTCESKSFWILAKALKDFVDSEGDDCLPVRGVIPDMTSDTQNYIKLQNIYKEKAEEDAHAVYLRVQELLSKLGKSVNSITEQEVRIFCKNAHTLRVLHGRSMKDEYDPQKSKVQELISNLEHEDNDILFYILLRAVDKFYSEYQRYPGCISDGDVESDIMKLKSCVSSLMQDWGSSPITKDDYIHEICRFGAAELHSIASFIGSCAAHEVIKLVTGQYVPLNNTLIYYALTQTTSTFCL